jgi:hypothetical protein
MKWLFEWLPGFAVGALGLVVLLGSGPSEARQTTPPAGPSGVPSFLQPQHCYRFSFVAQAAPHYKVVEILDHGWIRAEVDAGPPSPRREPVWINTAQIIAVRTARCSE